ncbi:signal recognition particle-related / SRP-like protein [Wolffia australiana]
MAQGEDASAMDVDEKKSEVPEDVGPKFSINVLQLLKSAQLQHGLRHRDYTRYRRYCTARLRRLYKSLKFTHGRGKYTRRTISETTVSDVRYLHVVLYMAERAWSYAMEKRQLPNGPNSHQRIHLLGRLRKAVKWATLFAQLCSAKGDRRTSLEAEAYASYMRGTLLFELDQSWETALINFRSARDVYEKLGKIGDTDNQILCRERVEELEPSIRYCLHKVGELNIQNSEFLDTEKGPAMDLLSAKLEAFMNEEKSQQAATLTEFAWLGHKFPVKNAKTRVSILKAREFEKVVDNSGAEMISPDRKLSLFEKIFSAYHDARSSIRNDLVAAGNAESVKDELNGLDKAVSAVLGQRTIERNQLLVKISKSKFGKQRSDKGERGTKPEELVRLYDLLIQNASDLSDLVSSGRGSNSEEVSFSEECIQKGLAFRAQRCFYLAKSYSLSGKRAEAYALFGHSSALAKTALKKLETANSNDKALMEELRLLVEECRTSSFLEHAMGILEEEEESKDLSKGVSSISLEKTAKKPVKFLLENLNEYESAAGDPGAKIPPSIAQFPPPFQAVPCSPIVIDIAFSSIDFPSLDHRIKKDRKSLFGRLWRFGSFFSPVVRLRRACGSLSYYDEVKMELIFIFHLNIEEIMDSDMVISVEPEAPFLGFMSWKLI